MSEIRNLSELKKGEKGIIAGLTACDDMRRRLQDIGLIEGTVVECLGKSPLGDPTAFMIRGAVIALRSEDSGRVLLKEEKREAAECACLEELVAAAGLQEGKAWD